MAARHSDSESDHAALLATTGLGAAPLTVVAGRGRSESEPGDLGRAAGRARGRARVNRVQAVTAGACLGRRARRCACARGRACARMCRVWRRVYVEDVSARPFTSARWRASAAVRARVRNLVVPMRRRGC